MEEKKRKGYATKEGQNEATRKYRATLAGKEKTRRNVAKSQAKKFIKEFATHEELEELKQLIEKREKDLKELQELKKRIEEKMEDLEELNS